MDTEALINFLKENLEIKVSIDFEGDINAAIFICGEEVSHSWVALPKQQY
jgi:hypothetical protein